MVPREKKHPIKLVMFSLGTRFYCVILDVSKLSEVELFSLFYIIDLWVV